MCLRARVLWRVGGHCWRPPSQRLAVCCSSSAGAWPNRRTTVPHAQRYSPCRASRSLSSGCYHKARHTGGYCCPGWWLPLPGVGLGPAVGFGFGASGWGASGVTLRAALAARYRRRAAGWWASCWPGPPPRGRARAGGEDSGNCGCCWAVRWAGTPPLLVGCLVPFGWWGQTTPHCLYRPFNPLQRLPLFLDRLGYLAKGGSGHPPRDRCDHRSPRTA